MTPREAAELTWAEDPRLMTPEIAALIAPVLFAGTAARDEEEAQATSDA